MKPFFPKNRKKIFLISLAAILAGVLSFPVLLRLVPDPLAEAGLRQTESVRIMDRKGRRLAEFLSGRETYGQWAGLEEMSPHLTSAVLAAEDRRFFEHPGVDPLAVLRAAWQNLTSGRVVSGASTVTMQVVRLLRPAPRTFKSKISEAFLALRMELDHSKQEILEQYLNRVPCGNLIYGAPAASRMYLGKDPDRLTPAEAAFIMALPQAPSRMNPYLRRDLALSRRSRILDRMESLKRIESDQAERAQVEPLNLQPLSRSLSAPHFVIHVRSLLPSPSPGEVRTTLDLELQTRIERLLTRNVTKAEDKGISQAAVVVMNHRTREILAWVGSADFFDELEGQNDGVLALRQPGSTVKPLTYATAFDAGLTPAFMIDDRPVEFGLSRGVYTPVNYDGRFRGPVSLRTALASSLNVPAVLVLERVGLLRVYEKMKSAGLTSLVNEPDYYGLGLTLGDGDISLLELVNAYATLASGGVFKAPVFFLPASPPGAASPGSSSRETGSQGVRVFSPEATFLVTDILSDDSARASGFGRDSLLAMPFPAAAKTGTSKNFRDNWTMGYTSSLVVGVWAGNFDARPMGRVSGISGAGPLWREVMRLAAEYETPQPFPQPEGVVEADVCPETGLRAAEGCPNRRTEKFIKKHLPNGFCLKHHPIRQRDSLRAEVPPQAPLAITSPRNGERYLFDPGIEPGFQNLALTARTSPGPDTLVWFVNGEEVGRQPVTSDSRPGFFYPLRQGRLLIRVQALRQGQAMASDQISITVQ